MKTPPTPDQLADLVATWGANVRTHRTAAGLTMADLAERCDTTTATISRIESGRSAASDQIRIAIAAALGVDVPDIWHYR